MSGIYIPGVTVPEDNTILLRIFPESDGIYYTEQLDIDEDILDKYFAIPVPEHGRLCNKDDVLKVIDNLIGRIANKEAREVLKWAKDCLSVLPTIIPASGGDAE